MEIEIPKLSTTNALDFCRDLQQCEYADTYTFNTSKVNNYEPLPMLLTSAAIRQFYQKRDVCLGGCKLRYVENRDFSYACHMGYFKAMGFPAGNSPGEAPGSATYIPLTNISINALCKKAISMRESCDQGDVIESKSCELAHVLAQDNAELQKLLQYLIREAIRNIPEHAGTDEVWLCGQYWHNRDLAEIAILDEGAGIYERLRENHYHRDNISCRNEALRWAVKPGISTAFNPAIGNSRTSEWANSGYGLYMISEICKATGGWLSLISDSAYLRVYSDGSSKSGSTGFHGTALGIRIRPSAFSCADQLITQMSITGQEEAKAIKNAFKEASTPSKGLLY